MKNQNWVGLTIIHSVNRRRHIFTEIDLFALTYSSGTSENELL